MPGHEIRRVPLLYALRTRKLIQLTSSRPRWAQEPAPQYRVTAWANRPKRLATTPSFRRCSGCQSSRQPSAQRTASRLAIMILAHCVPCGNHNASFFLTLFAAGGWARHNLARPSYLSYQLFLESHCRCSLRDVTALITSTYARQIRPDPIRPLTWAVGPTAWVIRTCETTAVPPCQTVPLPCGVPVGQLKVRYLPNACWRRRICRLSSSDFRGPVAGLPPVAAIPDRRHASTDRPSAPRPEKAFQLTSQGRFWPRNEASRHAPHGLMWSCWASSTTNTLRSSVVHPWVGRVCGSCSPRQSISARLMGLGERRSTILMPSLRHGRKCNTSNVAAAHARWRWVNAARQHVESDAMRELQVGSRRQGRDSPRANPDRRWRGARPIRP